MKQKAIFTLFTVVLFSFATAQETFVEINQGAGYANEVYYTLGSEAMTIVPIDQWDVAFMGGTSADIIINEGAAASGGQLGLYRVPAEYSFSDTLQPVWAEARLHNAESGEVVGAFGQVASPGDPFDLGWGIYDPISHTVGNGPTYMIQERDSSWLKFRVQALAQGKFIFEYAELDGAGHTVDTVDARGDIARSMIHYSLRDQRMVDEIPVKWDLVFNRYTTPLADEEGNTLEYLVTGVLQAPGIEVAEVSTMEPTMRMYDDTQDTFRQELDVIGYDWKSFNLQTFQFSIDAERLFFVKNREGEIWKLQFIDFEGSSTGVTVFTEARQDVVSSIGAFTPAYRVEVFPNPVVDQFIIDCEVNGLSKVPATWRLTDAQGRISRQGILPSQGRQSVDISSLLGGTYFLHIGQGAQQVTRTLIKQ